VRRITCLLGYVLPGFVAALCAAVMVAASPASGRAAPAASTQAELAPVRAQGTLAPLAGSIISVTYFSSVDGAELHYHEYLPAVYSPAVTYPLALLLPSLGWDAGQYENDPAWQAAADTHRYILLTVEPRHVPGYPPGYRGTFYIDGALLAGEQDVLDAMPSEKARHAIDPNRTYIAGFSMGGVGSLNIASQMPGLFAAVAPGAPISDLFEEWAYIPGFYYFDQLIGGTPGASVVTDSLWYENSPRFLLPNLMHTPVRFVHGISDTTFPNGLTVFSYMQSRHIVDAPGFTDTRGLATTMQELAAAWPGGYYEEHLWPQAAHNETVPYWRPGDILSFFDAHLLVTNPLTVAFTTYDNQHTRAYWLQMNLVQPTSARPALVYATRAPASNRAALQVTGSLTLTLDIAGMGLDSSMPLTLSVQPLAATGSAGDLAVVLSGTWPQTAYAVRKDGAALPPSAFAVLPNDMTLLRQTTDITHIYVFAPLAPRVYLPLVLR